ncbi:SDR family oxidoreductase [Marinobacter sp.]|uniref:SDR family oxidoreductase n=1 Tax=Marinobacter sp. TaxID=50741 RepID=UPI0034A3F6C4
MTGTENQDPRYRYPRPEFKEQPQNLPGQERTMMPEPDHGEMTYQGSGKLNGKVALITGGDSGIGKAIALAYAREGADVAFTYLSEDVDAANTVELIQDAGREALAIKLDQSSSEACDGVVEKVLQQFSQLDILVNNAAVQKSYDHLEEIPDNELRYTFNTNIESYFYFCRAALRHIPPGGSIINTTSIQAFAPSIHLAPYAATKAAIANFTLALAADAIKRGVRVNGVAPGPVWTPLIPATIPEGKVPGFGSNTLLDRPAQPAELAPVYVFLASPEASYVVAEIYGVTGGRMHI